MMFASFSRQGSESTIEENVVGPALWTRCCGLFALLLHSVIPSFYDSNKLAHPDRVENSSYDKKRRLAIGLRNPCDYKRLIIHWNVAVNTQLPLADRNCRQMGQGICWLA